MYQIRNKTLSVFHRCFCTLANSRIPQTPPWDLLFFGSDEFSLSTLKQLTAEYRKPNSVLNSLEIVTTVKNRSNVVHKYASSEKLTVHAWPPSLQKPYHVGVVVSFGHLIPKHLIHSFPLGMLNVHASILPRWRGAAPIIYAIANGDSETGVTVMRIRPDKFDIGEIIEQRKVPIPSHMRMPELYHALANLGADSLLSVIQKLPSSLVNATVQNDVGVTYAPRITANISVIDWKKQSAEQIFNLCRALDSLYLLSTTWMQNVVKISDISIDTQFNSNSKPGYALFDKTNDFIKICCANNSWISVGKIIVNKKIISAKDFNNGYFKKIPESERIFK